MAVSVRATTSSVFILLNSEPWNAFTYPLKTPDTNHVNLFFRLRLVWILYEATSLPEKDRFDEVDDIQCLKKFIYFPVGLNKSPRSFTGLESREEDSDCDSLDSGTGT